MKTALVFGGAFNPPTRAHIELAEYACRETQSDCVLFVPSKMSYIRNDQGKDFAFKDEVRLSMLRKISENRSWMEVSDYEILEAEQPRTFTTLCHLKEEGYECRLLFGSDKLPELENGWKHVREMAERFGIVCMARYNDNCEEMIEKDPYLRSLKPYITVIHTPSTYRNTSSTEVRKLFVKGDYEAIRNMVPEELDALADYRSNEDVL